MWALRMASMEYGQDGALTSIADMGEMSNCDHWLPIRRWSIAGLTSDSLS